MTQRHPEVGQVLSFDHERFPIHALLLERARDVVGDTLDDFSRLHEVVTAEQVKGVLEGMYLMVREPRFIEAYEGIIDTCITPTIDGAYRFQRVPSIRIHMPNARTVQFHSDYWYGHGADVINCWTPMTRSFGTNALRLASLDDSLELTRRLENERARQPGIDEELKKICRPVEIDVGQVQVFNAQTVHGSIPNTTDRTRVSIDFRLLLDGMDPGSKDPATYYRARRETASGAQAKTVRESSRAASYVFPKHGFTKHLPAASQRAVVDTFASKLSLSIVTEETEIFPMGHHPTLLNLAAGKGAQSVGSVVLFSVLCMPLDASVREELYRIAEESRVTLFFANESLEFPGRASRSVVEAAFARALEA